MGFPARLEKTTPADSDNPSAGAAQIRNLKEFIEDLFGITDAANYSAAAFGLGTDGQVTVAQPRMLLQNGSPTIPGFAFAGATGMGLAYDGATNAMAILRDGTRVGYLGIPQSPALGAFGLDMSSADGQVTWSAGVPSVSGDYINVWTFLNNTQRADVLARTGLVDCSAAIQSALNAGPDVFIPAGKYLVSTPLLLNAGQRIRGVGVGADAAWNTELRFSPTSGSLLALVNTAGVYDAGLVVEHLALIGAGGVSTSVGLHLQGAVHANTILRNLYASGFGTGYFMEDCIAASLEYVRAQTNIRFGIQINRSNAIRLLGVSAESNGEAGIYVSHGDGTAGENNGISILGSHIESNGNSPTGTFIGGIYIHQHNNPMILGSWIQAEAGAAVVLDTVLSGSIAHNYMTDGGASATLMGVSLVGTTGVSITDNEIHDFSTRGGDVVLDAASTRNIVQRNSSEGNEISIVDAGVQNVVTRSLLLSGNALLLRTGTPAYGLQGTATRYAAWAFDANSEEQLVASMSLPSDYRSGPITVRLYWTNLGAGSGDVVWQVVFKGCADAGDLNDPTGEVSVNSTITAPAQNLLKVSTHAISFTPSTTDRILSMIVGRVAADGDDDLANDAGLVAVEILY